MWLFATWELYRQLTLAHRGRGTDHLCSWKPVATDHPPRQLPNTRDLEQCGSEPHGESLENSVSAWTAQLEPACSAVPRLVHSVQGHSGDLDGTLFAAEGMLIAETQGLQATVSRFLMKWPTSLCGRCWYPASTSWGLQIWSPCRRSSKVTHTTAAAKSKGHIDTGHWAPRLAHCKGARPPR